MKEKGAAGMSLSGVLLVVFIVLKLCGVIGWSWLWVLAPLWIGVVLYIGLVIIGVILAAMGASIAVLFDIKKKK